MLFQEREVNARFRAAYRFNSAGNRGLGFTVLELLVVAAIIAVLVAIIVPSYQRARRTAAGGVCLSNLKLIGYSMATYATGNGGWFPAGPPDQISGYSNVNVDPSQPAELRTSATPREGGGWRPVLYTQWQFGGKRGKWWYLEDENEEPIPETLPRPLTREMYPGGSLDRRTPAFECPGDDGVYYYDRLYQGEWIPFGRRPLHEMVGNSYYLNLHRGGSDFVKYWRNDRKRISQVAMATDGVFWYDSGYYSAPNPITGTTASIRQLGWHGQEKTYNMLFLDSHAERIYIPRLGSNTRRGKNWFFVKYIYLMDYYR